MSSSPHCQSYSRSSSPFDYLFNYKSDKIPPQVAALLEWNQWLPEQLCGVWGGNAKDLELADSIPDGYQVYILIIYKNKAIPFNNAEALDAFSAKLCDDAVWICKKHKLALICRTVYGFIGELHHYNHYGLSSPPGRMVICWPR